MLAKGQRVVYCGAAAVVHLESVSIRDAATGQSSDEANRDRFETLWGPHIHRDEITRYAEDGLIVMHSDDVYPLHVTVDPLLASSPQVSAAAALCALLDTRSRQVFDLQKEVGRLSARLLDLGVEP